MLWGNFASIFTRFSESIRHTFQQDPFERQRTFQCPSLLSDPHGHVYKLSLLLRVCVCVLCCVWEWACVWRCTCADVCACVCLCVHMEARGWQWGSSLVAHNLIFETRCLIDMVTCWPMNSKDSPDHPYCPPPPQLRDYIGAHSAWLSWVLEIQLRALCLQGKCFIKWGTSSALEFISNK